MSLATGARAIMAWAMRGTKHLSPVRTIQVKDVVSKRYPWKKGTGLGITRTKGKPGRITSAVEYRPWAKWAMGSEKSGLGFMGIGAEGRKKAMYGYTKGYKHLKKHKKLYGAGVAGAAAWDFLPGKDNP